MILFSKLARRPGVVSSVLAMALAISVFATSALPIIPSSPASTMTTTVRTGAFIVEAGVAEWSGGDPCGRLSPPHSNHFDVGVTVS